MPYKILFTGGNQEWIQKFSESSTTIVVGSLELEGHARELEYEFHEHLATNRIIRMAVLAEKEGYDAFVIKCFYDPGLREARELVSIPVVGICEASVHIASMITAGKFSILVGRRKMIPKMSDNIHNYGLDYKIASWRPLNLPVAEMKDRDRSMEVALREAKDAVEKDFAECIILGCSGLWGLAEKVQLELGVPVLDPVLMGLKVAELRAMLWKKFGISQSKIGGYEAPPLEELKPIYKKIYGSYP